MKLSAIDPTVALAIAEELAKLLGTFGGKYVSEAEAVLALLAQLMRLGDSVMQEQEALLDRVKRWNAIGGPTIDELDELKAESDALDVQAKERLALL